VTQVPPSSQAGTHVQTAVPAKAAASTPFATLLVDPITTADSSTYRFSALGVFGRDTSPDGSNHPTASGSARQTAAEHQIRDGQPNTAAVEPERHATRHMVSLHAHPIKSNRPPVSATIVTKQPPAVLTSNITEPVHGLEAELSPDAAVELERRGDERPHHIRPAPVPPAALCLSEANGVIEVSARADLSSDETLRLRRLIEEASAAYGFKLDRIMLNGRPLTSAPPQSTGEQHGRRAG